MRESIADINEVCVWKYESSNGCSETLKTGCLDSYFYAHYGIDENFKYCPFCGKEIQL